MSQPMQNQYLSLTLWCMHDMMTAVLKPHLDRHAFALVLQPVADGGVRDVGEEQLELLEMHLGRNILPGPGLSLLCLHLLVAQIAHHIKHQSRTLNLPAGHSRRWCRVVSQMTVEMQIGIRHA